MATKQIKTLRRTNPVNNLRDVSRKSRLTGSVSDFEISPELKDMLENTKTLTTEEVEELGDAVRKTMDEIALEEKKQNT